MINVSIAGGTGYTGGELLRILLRHPQVKIDSVTTTTSFGVSIANIHRDLLGETDLCFTDNIGHPDVIFLCLGSHPRHHRLYRGREKTLRNHPFQLSSLQYFGL